MRIFGLCISLIAVEKEVPRYMCKKRENMVLTGNYRFFISQQNPLN